LRLRITLIPGFNTDPQTFDQLLEFAQTARLPSRNRPASSLPGQTQVDSFSPPSDASPFPSYQPFGAQDLRTLMRRAEARGLRVNLLDGSISQSAINSYTGSRPDKPLRRLPALSVHRRRRPVGFEHLFHGFICSAMEKSGRAPRPRRRSGPPPSRCLFQDRQTVHR
jgi:hypothetical protein